jgi:adenylate cyclase
MAMRLNPLYPEWYLWGLGVACFAAQRYQEAVDALERITQQNSESLAYLAASYAALGKLEPANAKARAILALEPDFTIDRFAQRLAGAGSAFRDNLLTMLRATDLPPK